MLLSDINDLLDRLGTNQVCRLLDVHVTTVKRWRTGKTPLPPAVALALRAAAGDILDKEWRGWGFLKGKLVSPEGEEFTPGNLRAIRYRTEQVHVLQQDNVRLEAALRREREAHNHGANDAVLGPVLSGAPAAVVEAQRILRGGR
jgi:transcriptional regulator with XRE-family HTH domain